jgi:hypothetical protein
VLADADVLQAGQLLLLGGLQDVEAKAVQAELLRRAGAVLNKSQSS